MYKTSTYLQGEFFFVSGNRLLGVHIKICANFNDVECTPLTKGMCCINIEFLEEIQRFMRNCHYIPVVSINLLSSTRVARGELKRRKQPLNSFSLTFRQLEDALCKRSQSGDGPTPSTVPNLRSALRAFLADQGLLPDTVIGTTLRLGYYRAVKNHLANLLKSGRTQEYVRNRKAALKLWRKTLLELDGSAASKSRQTPLQIALHELLPQVGSIDRISKETNAPLASLRRWFNGTTPRPSSAKWLTVIERHYALDPGTLVDLLPGRPNRARSAPDSETQIPYRQRLRKASRDGAYALKQPNEALRQEWHGLLRYKTCVRPANGLQRQRRGRWALRSTQDVAKSTPHWAAMIDGRYCSTGAICWERFAAYLGWLQLLEDRGGASVEPQYAHTLVWLTDATMIDQYVNWLAAKADGIVHGGIISFLRNVLMLCHPQTGYLTQSWNTFAVKCNVGSDSAWRVRCGEAFACAGDLCRELQAEQRPSRNPFDPIAQILALPNPLDAVADAVARLTSDRPITGGEIEAIWARDVLLIKLLTSNPLRLKNLQLLTYKADNTGHLRKVAGVWRIKISAEEFKNAKGAAKDRIYDMPVRQEIWPDIESYIKHYRPTLASADNPYVFVSLTKASRPWLSMSRHFAALTKRYFLGCPGVGTHSMRHIVATAILKANPDAWSIAALVLHDKEETVRKAYVHLASNDAARWVDPVMSAAFARM